MQGEQVPVLTLQHIEELSAMVRGIQQQNRKGFQDVISTSVDINHTTIINLYNIAVEEWHNKQKTIDNLCHFTLSMMNTIQLLWQKKYENDDKISSAEIVISSLERNLGQLNEQNESIKIKIDEAEAQLSNLNYEKDRMQELYRSSSCIAFQNQNLTQQISHIAKKCSACFDTQSQCQQEKNEMKQVSSKLIEEQQQQIRSLRESNRKLQSQFQELQEQHQLTKIQMELAQIAVQEALVYKSSYISMMSGIQQDNPEQHREDKMESKIKNKGSLQQNDEMCPLDSHILAFDLPKNIQTVDIVEHHYIDCSKEQDSCDLSLIKLETKVQEEKETTYRSPFRKKGQANCPQSQNDNQESFQQSAIHNRKDIVIFQSNIDFTLSSVHQNSKEKQKSLSEVHPSSRTLHPPKSHFKNSKIRPINMKKQRKALTNGEIQHQSTPFIRPRPYVPSEENMGGRVNESRDSSTSQNTINKFYNYISSKLVTNRIRRKK